MWKQRYAGVVEYWVECLVYERSERAGFDGLNRIEAIHEVILKIAPFKFDPAKSTEPVPVYTRLIAREFQKIKDREAKREKRKRKYAKDRGGPDHHDDKVEMKLDVRGVIASLSDFEQVVCRHLEAGSLPAEIARRLACDPRTVEAAIERIRERLLKKGYGSPSAIATNRPPESEDPVSPQVNPPQGGSRHAHAQCRTQQSSSQRPADRRATGSNAPCIRADGPKLGL